VEKSNFKYMKDYKQKVIANCFICREATTEGKGKRNSEYEK
jgi:hypothetical protein